MNSVCPTIARLLVLFIAITLAVSAGAQTESIVHSFVGGVADGGLPQSGLISDGKGHLFGTTESGGSSLSCQGCGTVFELTLNSSGTWTESLIYSMGESPFDGINPFGSLALDSKGNLYGTTAFGGSLFNGTAFQLSPGANGTWTETLLYNFGGATDGGLPYGGVVLDSAGNVYGTTNIGGLYGFGTVFELVAGTNGTWTQKVLYHFTAQNDGGYPFATGLVLDNAGNLYGMTGTGGPFDYGVVFKLTPTVYGNWVEKPIYAFRGGSGGSFPTGNLIFDGAGNLYGAATFIAFELSPNSNGTWTEKTLHTFTGGSDGASAQGGFVFDKNGILYGTTDAGGAHRGTVFALRPNSNGTWSEKILHRFSPTGGDGMFPTYGSVAIDPRGHVLGTTFQGGTSNQGVIFEIIP